MTIREIIIDGFGRHCGLKLELGSGVNVLYGENESGKSTITAFIRAMLYGLSDRGAQNEHSKYKPWQTGVKYGGELSFEHKGVYYRISAAFGDSRQDDTVLLYNDTTGEIIPVEENKTIGETVLDIPLETYDFSVYAAQLSSKPNLDIGNMDYLFDQLVKKSDDMRQSSSDITVGKRIKAAMDSISSPNNENSELDILQEKKRNIAASLHRINIMEAEAAELREEHMKLRGELKDIKEKHMAEKADVEQIAKAVQTVALHKDIKACISKINECDEDLANAAFKKKRLQRPATVILTILLLICVLSIFAVIYSEKLVDIPILQSSRIYQAAIANRIGVYRILCISATLICLVYCFIVSLGSGKVRAYKEELFDYEEELCDVLGIEYVYGSKNHAYNRENINAALEEHSREYKKAKSVLESETNKENKDKEYLETVEDYTKRMSYALSSADAISRSIDSIGDIEDLNAQNDEISESINIYKKRFAALSIAGNALDSAYKRWQAELGPVFGNEAGVLLGQLTGGRYNDLRVARNFDITLRSDAGSMHSSYIYSGATNDQMYLALRLALVKIISSSESMLPLILDDPFVQYDDKRRRTAYEVAERFTEENHSQLIMTASRNDGFPENFRIMELAGVNA